MNKQTACTRAAKLTASGPTNPAEVALAAARQLYPGWEIASMGELE